MRNIRLLIVAIVVGILFSGCGRSTVEYENKTQMVSLKINDEKNFNLHLNNPIYKSYSGYCIHKQYSLEDKSNQEFGYLFIDHVTLKGLCTWNGSAEGYLLDAVKSNTEIKTLKRIENKKIKNYEFSKFMAFDKYENFLRDIYLIEIWGGRDNTFIFVHNDTLYNQLQDALQNDS